MKIVTAGCDFGRGLHIRVTDRANVIMAKQFLFCGINECQNAIHSSLKQQNKIKKWVI